MEWRFGEVNGEGSFGMPGVLASLSPEKQHQKKDHHQRNDRDKKRMDTLMNHPSEGVNQNAHDDQNRSGTPTGRHLLRVAIALRLARDQLVRRSHDVEIEESEHRQ